MNNLTQTHRERNSKVGNNKQTAVDIKKSNALLHFEYISFIKCVLGKSDARGQVVISNDCLFKSHASGGVPLKCCHA